MTVLYPTLEDVLEVGEAATGKPIDIRDTGLLLGALQRPAQTIFGTDAYYFIWDKGAALLHSFTRNHPLVDGNKRTGLALTMTFMLMNDAYDGGARTMQTGLDLVLDVAQGNIDEVPEISQRLEDWLK